MKINKMLVSKDGPAVTLNNGSKVVAIYPAGKGVSNSTALDHDGKIVTIKGARICGVGVTKYFSDLGYVLAEPGNADAAVLADHLDAKEAIAMVEEHTRSRAQAITQEFGGKSLTFVPFDADKPALTAVVSPSRGGFSVAFDLTSGFSSGIVNTEYDPEQGLMCMDLSKGWIVDKEDLDNPMPRNTDYGGVIEKAVFVICNSGLGALIGNQNLEMDEDCAIDALYPRGEMVIRLTNGDLLTVGIDAVDELGVNYTREDKVLYIRSRLIGQDSRAFRLGNVIGSIAAALVRVQEMDATPAKKIRKAA